MSAEGQDDINCFKKYGYFVVKNAFSPETAMQCRDIVWDHMKLTDGVDRYDQSTWKAKVLTDRVWTEDDGAPWCNVFSDRLQNAIDSLVGPNQTKEFGAGWWTVTFPGFSDEPWGADGSWHIDGGGYQHYPFSKELGITPMMLFSDILPGGGGTAIAEGSHLVASRVLAAAGLRGCSARELSQRVMQSGVDFDITEITGEAGDVILLHPFLLHARSKNLAPVTEEGVRFLCHPGVPLRCDMDLSQPFGDLSVVEASIVWAIVGEEWDGGGGGKVGGVGGNEGEGGNGGVGVGEENDEGEGGGKVRVWAVAGEGGDRVEGGRGGDVGISNSTDTGRIISQTSEWSERRKLLNFISPTACAEFAARKRDRKNNENYIDDNEDEENEVKIEVETEEDVEGEEKKVETSPIMTLETGDRINENGNETLIDARNVKRTEMVYNSETVLNESYPVHSANKSVNSNDTSSNVSNLTSTIGVKIKSGNKDFDGSLDISEIMGFSGFKKSYRN